MWKEKKWGVCNASIGIMWVAYSNGCASRTGVLFAKHQQHHQIHLLHLLHLQPLKPTVSLPSPFVQIADTLYLFLLVTSHMYIADIFIPINQ